MFFFALSILNPYRFLPIPSLFSEACVFVALLFLVLYTLEYDFKIPLVTLPIIFITLIPIIQYLLGEIVYVEHVILPCLYIISFWYCIVVSYNIRLNNENHDSIILIFSYTVVLVGLLSSIIAIFQWLHLFKSFLPDIGTGNRPYGHLGQPNQLATFLFMSISALIFIFEKDKIKVSYFLIMGCFFIFVISLTQSRTAWIVGPLFFWYLFFKFDSIFFKIKKSYLVIFCIFFVISILILPFINSFLKLLNVQGMNTASISERVTNGYGRLDIWNQMIHAIIQKPLTGYGWYQTSIAQFNVINVYAGKEWVESSHNIFLDIFVWCGVPLALVLIIYFIYFIGGGMLKSSSLDSVISVSMLIPVIIHSMFEFPIFYSFFLLPFGFLLGIILAEKKLIFIVISKKLNVILFLAGSVFLYFVYNDYNLACDNLQKANEHEFFNKHSNSSLIERNYVFDKQQNRANFIAFNPTDKIDGNDLKAFQQVVENNISGYFLYKYALILARNGKEHEAKEIILINNKLYGRTLTYYDLLKKINNF